MTPQLRISLIFLIILLFFKPQLKGQDFNYHYYGVEDGLAQYQIYSIIQDSRGYMWFGSDGGGVSQYNGIDFKNYTEDDGLINNQIRSIFEDHQGNIWFGTKYNYISCFDGKKFKQYNKNKGLKSHTYISFTQDKNEVIWTGSEISGLYYLKNNQFVSFPLPVKSDTIAITSLITSSSGRVIAGTDNDGIFIIENYKIKQRYHTQNGLLSNKINGLVYDLSGNLWVATDRGINKINKFGIVEVFSPKTEIIQDNVTSISCDFSGNIWFNIPEKGVCKYDGTNMNYYSEQNGLKTKYICTIAHDIFGNTWIGGLSNPGLCKFESEKFRHISNINGSAFKPVMSIYEDINNNVWLGTYGDGVIKWKDKVIEKITTQQGLASDIVYSIFEKADGTLLFGTKGGGFSVYKNKIIRNYSVKNGLPSDKVYKFIENSDHTLWIATFGGGLSLWDGKSFTNFGVAEGLSSLYIYDILKDREGNLWIATEGDEIFKLSNNVSPRALKQNKSEFKKNLIHYDRKNGLLSNQILSLDMDAFGNLWVGTFGNGIAIYNGKRFEHYTIKDGLNSNYVYFVKVDSKGVIWVGTERGINKIIKNQENKIISIKNYNKSDGFVGIETNLNSILEDSKGRIWFGTILGATLYDRKTDHPNLIPPIVQITNIKLFFNDINWSKYFKDNLTWYKYPSEITFSHDENHLTFVFAGINLINSERTKYQWKLEGFDTKWSPITNKTEATYSNLESGTYTFLVRAKNSDDIWCEKPISFTFYIKPPIWKRWWFFTILILVIFSLLYTYIQWRTKKIKNEKLKLEELIQQRTYQLSEEKLKVETQTIELEKINQELEKLSMVARETDNSIAIVSSNGDIEWVNEGFTKLFGYTLEEYITIKGKNIIDNSQNQNIKEIINTCFLTKKAVVYETLATSKNHKQIWIQTTLSPILNPDGSLHKIVAIDSNITALKQAEEEIIKKTEEITTQRNQLSEALDKLKELESFKDTQAGMIVHDLKNPLNTIISFSSQSVSEKNLRNINQAARQTLNMVMNILDIQKYENAEMILNILPNSLYQIAINAINDVQIFLENKSISSKININREWLAEADAEIIQRVFTNLLTNAIKYTPAGGNIEIGAEKIKINHNEFLKIQVKDSGSGIPSEMQEKVFEKFAQVKARKMGAARSTGLGLTFCKLAIEAHKGIIWVESEENMGATFLFTLPFAGTQYPFDLINEEHTEIIKPLKIDFSETENEILIPFIPRIKSIDIYETSENIALVQEIKKQAITPNIMTFADELESAIYNFNTVKVEALISLINASNL